MVLPACSASTLLRPLYEESEYVTTGSKTAGEQWSHTTTAGPR